MKSSEQTKCKGVVEDPRSQIDSTDTSEPNDENPLDLSPKSGNVKLRIGEGLL